MNRDPRRDGVTAGAKTDQITSKPTTGSPRSFQRLARAIAQVSETTDPLAAALAYARAEWPVFPCSPEDKKPLTRFGFKDATTEAKQLCRWSEKWPHAMIGLRTGPEAGVFVLDVDRNAPGGFDGFAALSVLENQYGTLPETLRSVTPRTGSHYYFFWRDGIKNSAGRLGASLDVRGDGGYVILPPSRRADGKGYEWAETSSPVPIEAPQWLLDLLLAPKKPHRHCKQTIGRTAMPPHTHVRRLRANVTVSPRLSQDKETKR